MANMILFSFISLANIIFFSYLVNGSSDLGVNLGSKAAGKLATHCLNYALRQPRQLKLNLQTGVSPYFNKIAHVSSRTKLSLNNFTVNFDNDMVELSLYDVILKSKSDINLLPLPFLFGEDTAHLHAEVGKHLSLYFCGAIYLSIIVNHKFYLTVFLLAAV
jgi:hypothetical protein